MKRDQRRKFAAHQPGWQVENNAADDSHNDTDLQEYESSADIYERRWRQKIRYDRRDWWIAAVVYLLLASVAFVTL